MHVRPSSALLIMLVCAGCATGPAAHPAQTPRTHHATLAEPPAEPAKARFRRPPQFVMISFDGSGDADLWRHWREVGRRDSARFTFFLSGVYLLDPAHASLYHPPRHDAGHSDIGFSPDAATVADLVHQIDLGYAEGHEIGTHFNGHFCAPYAGSVATWTPADWRQEIDQFRMLLHHGGSTVPGSVIRGGRTPCLEGRLDRLRTAMRSEGMTYDASATANPQDWPTRPHGIWEFPLALIKLVGTPYDSLSMDYNFYVNQSDAQTVPAADAPVIEENAYRSYLRYFRSQYRGNRAPIDIGNHFATWNHGAYVRALTRFADTVCRMPEVRCTTYSALVSWLDSQPRRWIDRYRAGRFPHTTRVVSP
jgi:hypothetical protein